MHCVFGLSCQEDSEDGETGRRPSEDLMSDAEQASEDGKNTYTLSVRIGHFKIQKNN